MKTGFLVMAMTIGLLSAAVAGSALAGNMTASSADPEAVLIAAWTVQGPIETGMLPDAPSSASQDSRFAGSGGEEVPLPEVDGVRYRAGLDTGP